MTKTPSTPSTPRQPDNHRCSRTSSAIATPARCLLATLLLAGGLGAGVSAAAASDSAVVANIRGLSSPQVEALKQASGVHWWLELGDEMLLAGDAGSLQDLLPATPANRLLANVSPAQFALRGRGCSEHEEEVGTLIARGGRTELRRLDAGESMPQHAEWHAVQPNQVIVQNWRIDDASRAAPDPLIAPIVNAIDKDRWFEDMVQLTAWDRHSYSTQVTAARNWIGDRFEDIGLLRSDPAFTLGSRTLNNIVGTWTGSRYPDEWIVVGGHYDSRNASSSSTTPTPGAEDNATGCAGVIELARALVAFKPERTVIFMCYSGEEQGLYGSKAHVSALQQAGNLGKIKAVVTMDMIGYSADAQLDVLLETKPAHSAYIQRFASAATTYVPEMNVQLSYDPWGSDHVPYLDKGLTALLAIDADYDSYPHYHRSTDLPQNLGPHARSMGSSILKMNVAVLAELTGASDRIFHYDAETAP